MRKKTSLKIQLPNIFKDHHIVAKRRHTTAGDEWSSLARWRKFYNSHGKYNPELNEYFHKYRYQLNFAMFCPQVHLVLLGNISIIQIYLYAVFIDYMCIFMYN